MSDMTNRTYRLTFRVTKKELDFLKQVSGEEGRPVGNLIRSWLMLHYMEKLKMTPEEVKAIKELVEEKALAEVTKRKRGHEKKSA